MKKRDRYERTSRELRQAQAAVHTAARAAKGRPKLDDPLVQQWKVAALRFHQMFAAAYPQDFLSAIEALRGGENADINPIIEFLEADPIFFRSGYMKEEALKLLGRAALSEDAKARLTTVLLKAVRTNDRREFRRYCHLAGHVATPTLRAELEALVNDDDSAIRRRAEWMRDCLIQADQMRGRNLQ